MAIERFRQADWKYGDPLWPLATATEATPRPHDDVVRPLILRNALGPDQCEDVLCRALRIEPSRSAVAYPTVNCRYARSHWIFPEAEWSGLYESITRIFATANETFRYRITHVLDPLLVAVYPEGPGFNWHLDTVTGVTSTRKISLTLPLVPATDYEGGDLEISPFGANPEARTQGTATLFPSFLCHRVTPIRNGLRAAVVAWAHGPAFS